MTLDVLAFLLVIFLITALFVVIPNFWLIAAVIVLVLVLTPDHTE